MSRARSWSHSVLLSIVLSGVLLAATTPSLPAQDRLNAFEGISVAQADRTDVSRLTDAGVVALDNASGMVVTVAGEMKSRADRSGEVGVLFLPDVPFFDALFRTRRILLAVSEASAAVASGDSGYFVSKPKRLDVGFSRYRVLLYNSTGAAVTANVYVYATRN